VAEHAELIKIADAITGELKAAIAAGQFTGLASFYDPLDSLIPERSYADWKNDLDELPQLKVDVVPLTYEQSELETLGALGYVCSAHVGVRKWFGRDHLTGNQGRINVASIDRLVQFIQEIHEFFLKEPRRLSLYPESAWVETKILSPFSRKHLRDHRMFFGLLKLSYSVSKSL
jgi:hypothetical protein